MLFFHLLAPLFLSLSCLRVNKCFLSELTEEWRRRVALNTTILWWSEVRWPKDKKILSEIPKTHTLAPLSLPYNTVMMSRIWVWGRKSFFLYFCTNLEFPCHVFTMKTINSHEEGHGRWDFSRLSSQFSPFHKTGANDAWNFHANSYEYENYKLD